jgi:hypothetical protein
MVSFYGCRRASGVKGDDEGRNTFVLPGTKRNENDARRVSTVVLAGTLGKQSRCKMTKSYRYEPKRRQV